MATNKELQRRRDRDRRRARAQATAVDRRRRRQRIVVGAVAGTLAVAMVASLGVGFLAGNDDPDVDGDAIDLEDAPLPVELVAPEPGASIVGDTPCPETDGTQERTTTFESPPPICIDPDVSYDVSLVTGEGLIDVVVDTSDLTAANLFVTNARYGVYDDVPFWLVVEDGLAITGDPGVGDPGFTIAADQAARAYEPGDVLMWADLSDQIGSQFAIVASDVMAAALNSTEPAHPIIGTVNTGSDVVARILAVAGAPGGVGPVADVRVATATVTETP